MHLPSRAKQDTKDKADTKNQKEGRESSDDFPVTYSRSFFFKLKNSCCIIYYMLQVCNTVTCNFESSASASVLPMNIQGWFPLGLTSKMEKQRGNCL